MWVRIDDSFPNHPKLAAVGPLGWAVWLAGIAYCNRNLTDGFIPWTIARSLVNWSFLAPPNGEPMRRIVRIGVTVGHQGQDVTCEYVLPLLLESGLWDEVDGGYRVHDYHDYQPSKKEVLEERDRNNIRQQRFRVRNAVTNGVTPPLITGLSRECNAGPVPDPDPEDQDQLPPPTPPSLKTAPEPGNGNGHEPKTHPVRKGKRKILLQEPPGFMAWWKEYPWKNGIGDAIDKWIALNPSKELQDVMIAAVRRQCTWPDWTRDNGRWIPLPSTWLNQQRWRNEPRRAFDPDAEQERLDHDYRALVARMAKAGGGQ